MLLSTLTTNSIAPCCDSFDPIQGVNRVQQHFGDFLGDIVRKPNNLVMSFKKMGSGTINELFKSRLLDI